MRLLQTQTFRICLTTDPVHLPEKHLPEWTFSQKTLGRMDIISNVHFPERTLARNVHFPEKHFPEITFP